MIRLFVYGTLRPGSNNQYAKRLASTSSHVGRGSVTGRLYRIADYPGLTQAQGKGERVVGDVFEGLSAETLQALDDYEGEAYLRELNNVSMEDGGVVEAFVYRYVLSTNSLEQIRSGDWNQPDRIHD